MRGQNFGTVIAGRSMSPSWIGVGPGGSFFGPGLTPPIPGYGQPQAMVFGGGGPTSGGNMFGGAPPPAPVQGSSASQGGPATAPGETKPAPAQPAPARGNFGYGPAPQPFVGGAAPGAVAPGAAPTLAMQGQGSVMPATSPSLPPAPPLPQQPLPNSQANQVLMQGPPQNPILAALQNSMAAPPMDTFGALRRPWPQGLA